MTSLQAHTLRIHLLRWIFPALAAVVLIGVVAWPTIKEMQINSLSENSKTRLKVQEIALSLPKDGKPVQLQVSKPEFNGQDEQGRPYTITADHIVQDGLKPGTSAMNLDKPTARMTLDNTTHDFVALDASSGIYDPTAKTLQLAGPVKLTHSAGYQLDMQELFIDLQKGYSLSDHPVAGTGPAGTLSGEKLELRDKGNVIILHGKSKVTLTGDTADKEKSHEQK